jgi:CRP-like cAMP-binding protein
MHLHQPLAGMSLRPGVNRLGTASRVNETMALLQRCALFSDIPNSEFAGIVAAAHERFYSRRQILFLAGDPVRQTLLLTAGNVKLTQAGQNGCEVILRLTGAGEAVGAMGVCTHGEHCATAQALENCTVLAWDASTFEGLAERHPLLRRNMIRILESRLQEMDTRFREISTEKVAARLSSQILRLLKQVGKRINGYVEISLSREELAQLTGTTLFTVSRLLCQWELQGKVSARRETVIVHNVQALVEISQEE